MALVSVHVAKTGGTSIGAALQRTFGERFVQDYADDPANPLSARNLDPIGHLGDPGFVSHNIDCIHGHFHPGKYRYRAEDVLFTLLRDPVDNIISIHFFWKRLQVGGGLHAYFLQKKMDLFATARLPLLRRLYSETYFGGFDMRRFDLIGRHEARRETLSKLSWIMGRSIDVDTRLNQTEADPEREEVAANPSARARLSTILADDIRFYERHAR
jgi:hypothetical protein